MIKCPNCGISTRIIYIGEEKIRGLTFGESTKSRTCACQCGAVFEEIHTWQYIGVQANLLKVYNGKDE